VYWVIVWTGCLVWFGFTGFSSCFLSREAYKFHSLSLLNYDKERAERKIVEYKRAQRELPRDLLQSHREVSQRIQWQRNQLERAEPGPQREYEAVLDRLAQGLGDSVKRFSSEGNREAAKDALYRLRLVESEVRAEPSSSGIQN
ncbi:coiled-coil and C2 domain-containing protein 1A-like, partial [Huso huso]